MSFVTSEKNLQRMYAAFALHQGVCKLLNVLISPHGGAINWIGSIDMSNVMYARKFHDTEPGTWTRLLGTATIHIGSKNAGGISPIESLDHISWVFRELPPEVQDAFNEACAQFAIDSGALLKECA